MEVMFLILGAGMLANIVVSGTPPPPPVEKRKLFPARENIRQEFLRRYSSVIASKMKVSPLSLSDRLSGLPSLFCWKIAPPPSSVHVLRIFSDPLVPNFLFIYWKSLHMFSPVTAFPSLVVFYG